MGIRSNIESYLKEANKRISDDFGLTNLEFKSIKPSEKTIKASKTHFEKKYLSKGHNCHLGIWQKPTISLS